MATVLRVRNYTLDTGGVDMKVRDHLGAGEHAQVIAHDPALAAAVSSVDSSTTVVTLKAANTSRRGLWLYNNSTASAYVKAGSAATSSDFSFIVGAGEYYEFPVPMYTGIVTALWASQNGSMKVTELT